MDHGFCTKWLDIHDKQGNVFKVFYYVDSNSKVGHNTSDIQYGHLR